MKEKGIIVAQDLTPSDTAKMDMELVLGFVTEEGGVTSHVSIIAKNNGIPCLVGVGPMLEDAKTGMQMVLDAGAGRILLEPEADVIEEYKKKAEEFEKFQRELKQLASLPSETKDGHAFSICANAGNIADIQNCLPVSD